MSQEPTQVEEQKPPFPPSEVNAKKALIAIGIGVLISFIPAPEGLTPQSMRYLGIFIFMIVGMLTSIAQTWAVTTFAAFVCIILKMAPLNTLFSEFSGTTIWMLLAVVGFAGCMQESGLMKRIALLVLKFFPPNFVGQVLALLSACTVVNPIIPSSTAKLAMMSPLTGTVIQEAGLKPHSKGAKGLWFVMWVTVYLGAATFLTGSNITLILLAMLPIEVSSHFTWMNWFLAGIPWGIPLLVLTALYVIFFLRPEEKTSMTKETMQNQFKALGPMSPAEQFCLIVLVITVGMWITNDVHGIHSSVVSWLALFAMYCRGLFSTRDVVAKFPWALVMMFGPMMGVVALLKPMGIIDWVAALLPADLIRSMIPNAFVFVLILSIVSCLLRFVIDQLSMIPIILAIFGPIATILGINYWVILFVMWANAHTWPLPHHGVMIMQSFAMMGGDLLELEDVTYLTWVYSAITCISCLIAVPFWSMLGLL
ncbi:MAG: SLC13 family permease [Eubacteriaceae bacterium]|nr:SLC13 family permease [Eubacteriaceae bacterium]